jgi:hypothetical protein
MVPHHLFPPSLLHAILMSALLILPPDGKCSRCLLVQEHRCYFLHLLLNPNHPDGPPLRAPLLVPTPLCRAAMLSLLADILSDLAEVGGFFRAPCVCLGGQGRGAVAGWAQARRRRSWPLPGRATILSRRLAETDHSPICFVSSGRIRVKNACCKRMFLVFQMFHRYVVGVFIWMLQK